MNIWLPIVTNTVIALILIAGIFVGRKNGWIAQLVKLILTCGAAVGCYFLAPIITNALLSIELVSGIIETVNIGISALNSLCLSLSFLLCYLIIACITAIIVKCVKKHKEPGINKAKKIKTKSLDKKAIKSLKKENKKLRKLQQKQHRCSRVFGAIIGFIIAIIVAFAIILPLKYVFKGIAQAQPELEQIEVGYEYTPYGQLDKITGISDFINRGE